MKTKFSFNQEQLIDLVKTTIKNKFPHENIEIGKATLRIIPADRDGPEYLQSLEVEVDFKD